MIYQLPNGKIVFISVEQYLDLSDDDINYLCNPANNHGNYPGSLWTGSTISKKTRSENPEDIDTGIDYTEDDPDKSHGDNLGIEELPLDDFLDLPDEESLID